jgi:hypothetical protein
VAEQLVTFIPYDEASGEPAEEGLTVDVSLSESHTEESDITDFPIETGSTISDHVRDKPVMLRITGYFSYKDPSFLGQLAQFGENVGELVTNATNAIGLTDGPVKKAASRAIDLYTALRDAKAKQGRFQVITNLRIYYDMMIVSLVANLTPDEGDSITFEATLKKVIFAATGETAPLVEATPAAPAPTPKTKVSKTAAPTKAPPQSVIDKFTR